MTTTTTITITIEKTSTWREGAQVSPMPTREPRAPTMMPWHWTSTRLPEEASHVKTEDDQMKKSKKE